MINLITRNKAFLSAFKKGAIAAKCGKKIQNNPYPDKRNSRGNPTFSRAFRNFWEFGFNHSKSNGFTSLKDKK